jgi:hypothetical protein|tara:strand:+ start:538 stop:690 length:153 start_codon:yes stop_codon:yes gene_type:complete
VSFDDLKVIGAGGGGISSFYMQLGDIVQIGIGILTIVYIGLKIRKLILEK